jgi:superfamily II DNA helicase RecQ
MTINYKVIGINAKGDEDAEKELNDFLRIHRIVHVEKSLVMSSGSEYWTFCVEYLEKGDFNRSMKKTKVDYRDLLTPTQFTVFDKLRKLRKTLANSEGVPVFSIFTNEQLSSIVTRQCKTTDDLRSIQGVGDARIEKYGRLVMEILAPDETNRVSD